MRREAEEKCDGEYVKRSSAVSLSEVFVPVLCNGGGSLRLSKHS